MFSTPRSRRLTSVVAGASIMALALSACSSDDEASGSSTNADGKIELTVATFNNFGYTDEPPRRVHGRQPERRRQADQGCQDRRRSLQPHDEARRRW